MKTRIVLACFLLYAFVTQAHASTGNADLVQILENPERFDGKEVELTGEAVGIYIRSGNGYFIQLNQDAYIERSISEGGPARGQNLSIAVYLEGESFKKIKNFGDYDTKGDIVSVKGVFRVSCPVHRGETDIHADELRVIKRGYRIKHEINVGFAILSTVLFVISVLLFFFKETIRASYYRIIYKKERM